MNIKQEIVDDGCDDYALAEQTFFSWNVPGTGQGGIKTELTKEKGVASQGYQYAETSHESVMGEDMMYFKEENIDVVCIKNEPEDEHFEEAQVFDAAQFSTIEGDQYGYFQGNQRHQGPGNGQDQYYGQAEEITLICKEEIDQQCETMLHDETVFSGAEGDNSGQKNRKRGEKKIKKSKKKIKKSKKKIKKRKKKCQQCFKDLPHVLERQATHRKYQACSLPKMKLGNFGKQGYCKSNLCGQTASRGLADTFSNCASNKKRLRSSDSPAENNEATHQYETYGQMFLGRFILIRHSRTDSMNKPYQCPDCGHCFSYEIDILTHIKRIPSGEWRHYSSR